jgi:muconolactone delta-isomerase
VHQGHLVRLWNLRVAPGETRPIGLYRAETETEMDHLLRALPLYPWMRVTVTPFAPIPTTPPARRPATDRSEPCSRSFPSHA